MQNARGAAARRKIGVKCPVCGGEIVTTPFGYGCANYKMINQDVILISDRWQDWIFRRNRSKS